MGASNFPTTVRVGVIAVLVLVVLTVAGCGGGGSGGSDTSSSAQPKKGGSLTISIGGEVESLDPFNTVDPAGIDIVSQTNEPLMLATPNGEVEPWLATSIDSSSNQTRWTVHLRSGVKFSDGKPMTAADVAFTLNTARKAPYTEQLFAPISDVKAESNNTVLITTSKPMPALPYYLTIHGTLIVPKDFGGRSEEEFAQEPVGTGAFEMASWKHGASITLERNPLYWKKGMPYLDQVVFVSSASDSSRTTQLKSGSLDVISRPGWTEISALEQDPKLRVEIDQEIWTESLLLNVEKPVFANRKVREAVSVALNRESVVKTAFGGHAKPAGSWLGPAVNYWDESIEVPTQDASKAKQLLAEAASEGSAEPSFSIVANSEEANATLTAQILQQNLEEAGFKVKLEPLEGALQVEQVVGGKYDAAVLGFYAGTPDPSENIAFYNETSALFTHGKTNDAAGERAATEPDETKREQLYKELQNEIAHDHAVIPINYEPFTWAMQQNVAGFGVTFSNAPLLLQTGFAE
jgi:peptide/nickel transport system substrate-binding protein